MTDKEMLEAMEALISCVVKSEVSEAQRQTIKDVDTLMDAQFMGQFKLLAEGQEEILRKMPSEDDMDIIDARLQEHADELKILRRDVNELKRAQ